MDDRIGFNEKSFVRPFESADDSPRKGYGGARSERGGERHDRPERPDVVQYGDGQLSSSELEERAHQTAQRLSLLYEFNSPEFFDKTVLRNFIQQLQRYGLTETDDSGKLTFNEKLTTLDEEAQLILSPHISQSIQRITRREER